MRAGDTIVALSSGALPAGVAIVRLSGPQAGSLLETFGGPLPPPRFLRLAAIGDDDGVIDHGLVAWFPGPHSFTGEDCAELHLHGSPAGVRALLRRLTQRDGVRLAEAGEFTRRAFENGKLDLTEVEGLGDLLAADTEGQRRQALRRLDGALSRQIEQWRTTLINLQAEIEARLDFADEDDVSAELPVSVSEDIGALVADLRRALAGLTQGRIVRDGFRVALAGPPNAGKSSLLNALANTDVAIVSAEAGTTRDVREVALDLAGQLVILVDMAGLRETQSEAEAEGVRRAKREIDVADLILWLVAPDVEPVPLPATPPCPLWTVVTKTDLVSSDAGEFQVSAKAGIGLETLLTQIAALAQESTRGEPAVVSRERDREALDAAIAALEAADLRHLELAAEALRRAGYVLSRLIGRVDAEMVLDRLFAGFCIGK